HNEHQKWSSTQLASRSSKGWRSSQSPATVNEQRELLLKYAPDFESGKLRTFDDLSKAIHHKRSARLLLIGENKINEKHAIFKHMSDSDLESMRGLVSRMHDKYIESKATRLPHWMRTRSRPAAQPSEGFSNPPVPHVIETPGLSFNDVYGQGIESDASGSSTSLSERPGGVQTYGPSPSFFDEVSSGWGAGSSSGTAARSSPVDSSRGGEVRQRAPDFEGARHPQRVVARDSTGGTSATATDQSRPPALEPLNDREFSILLETVGRGGDIRSVEDAALYMDDAGLGERLIERVRPYVSVVGDGDNGFLQLTEFGMRQKEERSQRETGGRAEVTKRQRNHLIHHPTTPLIQGMEVKMGQVRIVDGRKDPQTTGL
ncbi:MAG TPA: hypothetical protein VFP68_05465, partial [Burkholderiaceae bacterium]|nr:hypothetical protein [Burkholderiaceae bacterium]